MSEALSGFAQRARTDKSWWVAGALILFGAIYPLIVDSLQEVPLIGDFMPGTGSVVVMLIFTMMALGLNVVVGYAGLLDLGYVAFYAAGAYVAGWFASLHFDKVTFHLGSAVSGDLPGHPPLHVARPRPRRRVHDDRRHRHRASDAPAARRLPRDRDARIRRDRPAVRAQRRLDRRLQPDERHLRDHADRLARRSGLGSCSASSRTRTTSSTGRRIALVLFTVFCCIRLRDSRLGRAWIAIREDETAAAAMGVPLMRTKTWSYAIGAFFGGIAGAYFASYRSGAFPADFFFQFSVFLLCMVILGGIGSIWGVVAGALILAIPRSRGARDDRREAPAGRGPRLRSDEVPVRNLRAHHRDDDAASGPPG